MGPDRSLSAVEVIFTTPKLPPSLGLDLAHLAGSGACPAQFFGTTHDGRGIYARYRGGWLSVRVATHPGQAATDGVLLLDHGLGTRYDGHLSLAQLCAYAGISVNSVTPPLTDRQSGADEGYTDLSGATTFCEIVVHRPGADVARRCLSDCLAEFDNSILLIPRPPPWGDGGTDILTVIQDPGLMDSGTSLLGLGLAAHAKALLSWHPDRPLPKEVSSGLMVRAVHLDLLREGMLPGVTLTAQFQTTDPASRAMCERLGRVIQQAVLS